MTLAGLSCDEGKTPITLAASVLFTSAWNVVKIINPLRHRDFERLVNLLYIASLPTLGGTEGLPHNLYARASQTQLEIRGDG